MPDKVSAPSLDDICVRLRAAGIELSEQELRGRIHGVAAAPPRAFSGRDLSVIAPGLNDEALIADLKRAVDRIAETYEAAFAEGRGAERVAALRAALKARGLAGFIVPSADEYQGEYVPIRAQRRAWLTGFDGSAGTALVLMDRACLFTDGRYTLQARRQLDPELFEVVNISDTPLDDWLREHAPEGAAIGYDPWLHTQEQIARYRKACEEAGADLVAVSDNPVDAIWRDQPPLPLSPAVPHDLAYCGEEADAKRARIAEAVAEKKAEAAVLSAPDSIAWLLNIRGADVLHTPLALAFAILQADARVDLFIDPRKVSAGLIEHLGERVALHPPAAFEDALRALGKERRRVLVDPATSAARILDLLEEAGAELLRAQDPCLLPKACKNEAELAGARAAHRRDGAALTRFLAWLDREAPKGGIDEMTAADRLAAFRAEGELFRDLSFETISGAGANGAIVHYRTGPETNRRLEPGTLYLADSGGQYLDGTTDVTRTIAIGTPTDEHRDRFTRVLKGHIALSLARFPRGTTGSQLDALARLALWEVGLDYDHGTGHGVGSYLAVHEGPQRISKVASRVALEPGMIVSDEPGYYKEGAYGIRIENLVVVIDCGDEAGGAPTLGFEPLTLAPIDRALIVPEMLTARERAWLNAYHSRVREELAPLLDDQTAGWLEAATRPL